MRGFAKRRGFALLMVVVLLVSVSTAFATEEAVKTALSGLYDLMDGNKTTAELDRLDLLVLENVKADADNEASKIFNTGVYEQGFDNTVIRDVRPDEAKSRIAQEQRTQAREPLVRDGALYKAIQSLVLLRAQQEKDTRLLALTKDEVAIAQARFDAGIISAADLTDEKAAIASAELGLEKNALSITAAELEVNRLAGTDFDTLPAQDEETALTLLDTAFADMASLAEWERLAIEADPSRFTKREILRILDMKLKIAEEFIPDTHSRVVEMKRDREDARLSLKDAEEGLLVDLRNKLNDRLTAVDTLELARLDLDMAKRRQELAQIRYDAGVANKLDLLEAERTVLQADQSVLSAIATLNNREVDLRVLVGLAVRTVEEELPAE